MVQLYKYIYEYQIRLMRQFSNGWAHRYGRDVVKADDWDRLLADIKLLDSDCSTLARELGQEELECGIKQSNRRIDDLVQSWDVGLQDLQRDVRDTAAAVQAHVEIERMRRAQEETSKCLQALCIRNPYEDQKNRTPSRQPGTCNWFLNNKQFQKWRGDPLSSLLWVSANPGCGKSVLSKSIVEEKLVTLDPKSAAICYFFFKDVSPDSRSITKALSAVLHQLFTQKPALAEHALTAYASNGQDLPTLFSTMWDILVDAARDPKAGEIICVLDAVDECEEAQQVTLLETVRNFYSEPESSKSQKASLRFLLTSRPYRKIGQRFHGLLQTVPTIHLSGDEESDLISEEIDLVIREKVSEIASERSFDRKTEDFLLQRLLEMENRTYLWLHLILDQIQNSERAGNAKEMQKEIKSIPQSVSKAYEAILSKIKDKRMAEKLLHIIVGAEVPMTVQEVNVAMSIEKDSRCYEDLGLESSNAFETRIKNVCGLFIYIDRSRVYLIYQTAKEFLVNKVDGPKLSTELWENSLRPEDSNALLTRTCVTLLLFKEFQKIQINVDEIDESVESVEWQDNFHEGLPDRGFLLYAASHWTVHLSRTGDHEQNVLLEQTKILCDTDSSLFSLWFFLLRLHKHKYLPGKFTDLAIASAFGLKSLVQLLLSQDVSINAQDGHGATALQRAVEGGHIDLVKFLLESGADTEVDDWEYPWHTEIDEKGSERDVQPFSGRPLWMAAGNASIDIIRMLVHYGADINAQRADIKKQECPEHSTALHHAVFVEKPTSVQTLLELGASIDVRANASTLFPHSRTFVLGATPLHIAVGWGDVTVLRQLLEHGADIDAEVFPVDDEEEEVQNDEEIDSDEGSKDNEGAVGGEDANTQENMDDEVTNDKAANDREDESPNNFREEDSPKRTDPDPGDAKSEESSLQEGSEDTSQQE